MAVPNSGRGYSEVTVKVWDAEGNSVHPMLQFRELDSTNWMNASVEELDGSVYGASSMVSASSAGTEHALLWNSSSDLGVDYTNGLWLRASASDITMSGPWSEPVAYDLRS